MDSAIAAVGKAFGDRTLGGCVHAGGIGMAGLTVSANGEPFSLDAFRSTVEVNVRPHSRVLLLRIDLVSHSS